jgi:hypothetical protein
MQEDQTPNQTEALLERYVAVWNEPTAEGRRAGVDRLWSPAGLMINRLRRYEGHEAITDGVRRSYDAFVARGFLFATERFIAHHDAILLFWLMRDPDDRPDARGINYLQLDGAGRIWVDHQFTD